MSEEERETTRLRSLPILMKGKVDREEKVIRGVSMAQATEALGHDFDLDKISIQQIVDLGNENGKGVKSRYTHPGLSSDGLGKFLGRIRNLRVDGDKAIGDLHISPLAFKSPEGNLGEYIMDFAEEDPESFGMSVVISGSQVWRCDDGGEVPTEEGKPSNSIGERPALRVDTLRACDAVDEPAANRDGMFSSHLWATNLDAEAAFQKLDELLQQYEVGPDKAKEFAVKYFHARGFDMSEQPEEVQGTEEVSEPATEEKESETVAMLERMVEMEQTLLEARIDSTLARSGLSMSSEAVVRDLMHGREMEELDGFIGRQREIEAIPAEKTTVKGVAPMVTSMRNSLDKVELAVDALVSGTRPPDGIRPLQGVRELYVMLSGDYDLKGGFHGENIELASVTAATMPELVANAMNKAVTHEFIEIPQFWGPIVREVDSTNLQQLRWLQLGGLTDIPEVAEGAAYQEIAWEDATETGDWEKRGYYMGLTMEAIDKDDTSRLQQAPRAMAVAANRTLGRSISKLYTQASGLGPTLNSDSTAWFDNTHGNLGSTALSRTSVQATILAMQKQTELGSGELMGDMTRPKYFMLPIDLEFTALEIFASMYDGTEGSTTSRAIDNTLTDVNTHSERMSSARSRMILNPFMTDTNNWVAIADPAKWPTVAVAYRYGRSPEIFSNQDPNSGLMFTNDTLPIKVRFLYNVSVLNYRGVYKHNVG